MTRDSGNQLIHALCHEMGNVVGALRLETHLLDQDMTPRDLARARADLDALGGRLTGLLALVRPLIGNAPPRADRVRIRDLMASVEHAALALLVPGVDVSFDEPPSDWVVAADAYVIESLVVSFLHSSVEQVRPAGHVRIGVQRDGAWVSMTIEDGGPVDEDPARWKEQAMRGRPLLCAVADVVLRSHRGRLVAERPAELTRIELWLPLSSPGEPRA